MSKSFQPRGLAAGHIEHRFASATSSLPQSYDSKSRSVDAVISMGSPVQRSYGTEVLRISPEAVDLSRMTNGGIPLLDSHARVGVLDNHLGRISQTWFRDGALWGTIVFDDTERGRTAEGMVARGEIAGISAGYRVDDWQISDSNGKVLNPDKERINFDDDLVFTATRWHLYEASLVSVAADPASHIRSLGARFDTTADVRARMQARQRMHDRQAASDAKARMIERQRASGLDYDPAVRSRSFRDRII